MAGIAITGIVINKLIRQINTDRLKNFTGRFIRFSITFRPALFQFIVVLGSVFQALPNTMS
jgi:hypothetical protein